MQSSALLVTLDTACEVFAVYTFIITKAWLPILQFAFLADALLQKRNAMDGQRSLRIVGRICGKTRNKALCVEWYSC